MAVQFILAISTSSGIARVAASACSSTGNTSVLFDFEITDYKSQSALLLPQIQNHLAACGLRSEQAVAIAVDIGPGGFTSLRTACGIAQGLAVAWSIPTIPLSSFECMLPVGKPGEPLSVLIDARLNEVYFASLERTENGTRWIETPGLLSLDELNAVIGPAICDRQVYSAFSVVPAGIEQGEVSAIRLAELAWQEYSAGRLHSPLDCQPLYVRDKVAQTTSERLALKHGA